MKQIELENWTSSLENPNESLYAGQRKAQEVFAELKSRLENIGMLPDEYFLLDDHWENGREIPKDAHIFSTVMYGESEGIYLDIGIRWDEDGKRNIKTFATGKTLGESESHLDRMYLTASAVNKALYANEPHARYVVVGGVKQIPEGGVFHLNGEERRLLIDSLVERRNHLLNETTATENLLRRVTGSITALVNEVGAMPLHVSDFDKTILAIQDGNMAVFRESYLRTPEQMGDILMCAAGRPGRVGFDMTSSVLAEARDIPCDEYLTACYNAVLTGDAKRVLLLTENAEKCVADLDMALYGKVISKAISEHTGSLALELVKQCTPKQIQAANPYILAQAVGTRGTDLPFAMAEKGINVTFDGSQLIYALKNHQNDWILKYLFERGMKLDCRNLSALQACIRTDSVEMGQVLIDRGADFAKYEGWDKNTPRDNAAFIALKQYADEKAKQALPEQPPAPEKAEKPDIATRLAEGKAKADAHNAARSAPDTPSKSVGAVEQE